MNPAKDELLEKYSDQLLKSLQHLEYSFQKVSNFPLINENTDEESLESWESFSSRFSRASDLFVGKVLKRLILQKDPAFRGSLIDLIHEAEKYGWINNADAWKKIREFGNIAAHEYAVDDLAPMYKEILRLTPFILECKNVVQP